MSENMLVEDCLLINCCVVKKDCNKFTFIFILRTWWKISNSIFKHETEIIPIFEKWSFSVHSTCGWCSGLSGVVGRETGVAAGDGAAGGIPGDAVMGEGVLGTPWCWAAVAAAGEVFGGARLAGCLDLADGDLLGLRRLGGCSPSAVCVFLRRGAVFLVGVVPGVIGPPPAAAAERRWWWCWSGPFCMKDGMAKVGGGGAVSTPTQKSRISSYQSGVNPVRTS